MRTFYLTACLFLCPFLLAGETVMVSVGQEGLTPGIDEGYRFCLSAIESGAMDAFFDAGHIIFNDEGLRTSQDRYRAVRVARDGGASAVLFIDCLYSPGAARNAKTQNGAEVSLPEKIVLSYVRVKDFTVIRVEEFFPSAKDAADYPFIEKYYALLGRSAVKIIL
jgi:hypothetical protein